MDGIQHLFPPTVIAAKIVIALGIGILVGLEREWAHKDVGVRTFAITALLGMLAALLGSQFALAAIVGVFILVIYANLRSLLTNRTLEITTSVSLMVVVVLGVLTGEGHLFTPIASAVVVTLLLSWKVGLTRFAGGLKPEEIRSAVLLGLLGLVIYPILPNRFVDKWQVFNPHEAWLAILGLAGIGFANYVLLRLYGARGLYYTAVLGGAVNSTSTVAELCAYLEPKESASVSRVVGLVLLTRIAMFLRNLLILVVFAPRAAATALWPLLCMTFLAGLIVWRHRERAGGTPAEIKLASPVSLRRVLMFGAIFVAIQVASILAERYLGRFGFLMVSFMGGLVSSASTTASAALLAARGNIAPNVAGIAVVLTSISSALVNLPLIYQQTRHRDLTRALTAISFLVVLLGLGVLAIREQLWHW